MTIARKISLEPWSATQSYIRLSENLLLKSLGAFPVGVIDGVKKAAQTTQEKALEAERG